MKRFLSILVVVSACFCMGGCITDQMSYSQWQAEQKKRSEMEKAGIEYKSPAQIKKEVEEMRKAVQNVRFN
jgi:hypothetical protein